MKIISIQQPTILPVALESIKEYLRVLDDYQDAQIELISWANIQDAENITNLTLRGVCTYQIILDDFMDMSLPRNPLHSIGKIEYRDQDDILQILTEEKYNADKTTVPATLVFLQVPSTTEVVITFKSGYTKMPKEVEMWLKAKVLEEYDRVENTQRSKHLNRMLDSLRIVPV